MSELEIMQAKSLTRICFALFCVLAYCNGLPPPSAPVKDSKPNELQEMGKSIPSQNQDGAKIFEAELGRGSKSKKKDSKSAKLNFAEEMQEYMNKFIKQNKARHEKMMAFLKKLKVEIEKAEEMLKKIEEDDDEDESSESKGSAAEHKNKVTTKAPNPAQAGTTKAAQSSVKPIHTTTTKSPAQAGSSSKAPTTRGSSTTPAPPRTSGTTTAPKSGKITALSNTLVVTTAAPAQAAVMTKAPVISNEPTPAPGITNSTGQTTVPPLEIKDSPFAEPGLELINQQRAKHHAPPLALIANLTASAQQWADQLSTAGKISHSCPNYTCGYGENVAMMGPQSDIAVGVKNGIQDWYDEVADYDYVNAKPTKEGARIGHFTANVWINTTHVGFGATRNATSGQIFIVAQFHPPGNWVGDYQTNVLPP